MSTERPALERAIARELGDEDGVLGAATSAEQLELLRGGDGRLPTNVFQLARGQSAERRGPGRPAGSGNRRNDMLAKLVTQQHGDPVMAMASLYSRPLDQLAELVMIADGSREREEWMARMAEQLEGAVKRLLELPSLTAKNIEALAQLVDRLVEVGRTLRSKPGDLGIKALNLQLAAARAVAEYVHSKKPVEAVVTHKSDGVLVMPAAAPGVSFEEKDDQVRMAADGIAKMLAEGAIDPARLADYRFVEGQFVEAEWTEAGEEPA